MVAPLIGPKPGQKQEQQASETFQGIFDDRTILGRLWLRTTEPTDSAEDFDPATRSTACAVVVRTTKQFRAGGRL